MNESLHERERRLRERTLIRSWEYRQRNHARGVWYRFRRVLVDAAQAWIIDERDADRLESDGLAALPIGNELAPPKRVFLLTEELLQARSLVLIAHG